MAKLFLETGDIITVQDPMTVFGSTGAETLKITGAGVTANANVDRIEFAGNVADYTFQIVGTQVFVFQAGVQVATIGVQEDVNGTKLAFADGSADLVLSGLNAATLGGTSVPTVAAAVVPATIDANDPSDVTGGGTGPTGDFTLSAAAPSFNEGSTMIYTVTAAEPVAVDTIFSWSLSGGSGENPASAEDFSTATSGTVTIRAGQSSAKFSVGAKAADDAEFAEAFTVTLTDSTGTSVGTVTTTINDTSTADVTKPVVTAGQEFSYVENSAANTLIDTVEANDDPTSFNIVSGNADGFFAIDNSGNITLTAAGAAAAANDFETTPNVWTLGVTATDAAGNVSVVTDVVLNELDVDDTAPVLAATAPVVLGGAKLFLNFNETLVSSKLPVASDFRVLDGTSTVVTVNLVTISGSTVILDLAAAPSGAVTVAYTPNADTNKVLQDSTGNLVGAIAAQTAVADTTPPALTLSSPTDGATDVAIGANLVLNMSENVKAGTGNIVITNLGDNTDVRTIAVTDATQVSITGSTVTVNPAADLKVGAHYAVTMASGVLTDVVGNAFAGISGTNLDFTTAGVTPPTPGQTYLLTNSLITGKGDEFIGTSGDDTFNGLTVGTFETGDKLDGGAGGTDKIEANLGAPVSTGVSTGVTIAPVVTGVENWFVATTGILAAGVGSTANNTVNMAGSTGYQQLWYTGAVDPNGNGDLSYTDIASAADLTLGIKNVAGTAGAAAAGDANLLTATFVPAAVTGASDTVKVALDTVGQNDPTGTNNTTAPALLLNAASGTNGVENLEINVTGGAARLTRLASESATAGTSTLKSITVTGNQDLTVGVDAAVGGSRLAGTAIDFAGGTGTGTINAQTFTGALNLNLANGDAVDVTGGSGNDRFAFGAGLSATDKIDGGAGTGDVLAANLFSDVVATSAAGRISNIEAVELQNAPGTEATLDTSKVGNVGTLTFAAGIGNVKSTVNNMVSGATINIEAATGGAGIAQINVKDANLVANTSDVLNLNFGTATTAAEFAVGNINTFAATGVETINIHALGSSAISGNPGTNQYTATIGNDASLKTIKVDGNGDMALTYAGASLTTYDASTANGAQTTTGGMFSTSGATIKGGSKADVLVGSGGNDVIDAGAGNDFINGGLGSDKITTGAGRDTVLLSANGNAVDQINAVVDAISDFTLGSGGDVLDVTVANVFQSGARSLAVVNALTSALPATSTATTGRAELLVLDSTQTAMQAANAKAVSDLAFNLGATDYLGQNVLVAYAPNATANVRLAYATVANVGGSIKLTNVVDMTVLENITTATLATGFNEGNLTGLPTALLATAAAFNTNTGANIQGGQTVSAASDNVISTTGAFLLGSTAEGTATVGTTDVLQISDNAAVALSAAASLANLERIDLQVAHNGLTMDVAGAPTVRGSAGADTVIIANNGAMTFDGVNGGADVVVIGTAAPTATLNNLGADDTIRGLAANNVASIAGVNAGAVTGAGTLDLLTNAATYGYTMTAAQHNGFAAINAAGGDDNLVLTTAGTIVGDADIQGYSVVEGSTFTMGALGQNVTETGAIGTVSTVIFGAGAYNGVFTTFDANDVARVVNGTDLSGITVTTPGVIDFQGLTGTLTLNNTQNGTVTYTGAGGVTAQTVAVTAADTFTTNAAIENYELVGGGTVTLDTGHTGVSITATNAGATTVNIGGQTVVTPAGGYNLQHANDVLQATNGADIKGLNAGNATTAETLTLANGATITMTGTQLMGFTTITNPGGVETVNISTQSDFTTPANAVTLTNLHSNLDTIVFQSTAADQIRVTNAAAGASYTGTIDLTAAGGADIVRINNTFTTTDSTSEVTINNFTLAGVGVDKLQIFSGATAISDGTFQAITVADTAQTGEVLAIHTGTLTTANLQDTANAGAVETLLLAALGATTATDYTVVIYDNANNAGIYQMNVAGTAMTAAANLSVELLGIVSNVGPYSLTNVNFA